MRMPLDADAAMIRHLDCASAARRRHRRRLKDTTMRRENNTLRAHLCLPYAEQSVQCRPSRV